MALGPNSNGHDDKNCSRDRRASALPVRNAQKTMKESYIHDIAASGNSTVQSGATRTHQSFRCETSLLPSPQKEEEDENPWDKEGPEHGPTPKHACDHSLQPEHTSNDSKDITSLIHFRISSSYASSRRPLRKVRLGNFFSFFKQSSTGGRRHRLGVRLLFECLRTLR